VWDAGLRKCVPAKHTNDPRGPASPYNNPKSPKPGG
jgi:hypothetical protein